MVLAYWTLFYATPMVVAAYLKNTQTDIKKRVLILHVAIVVSILLLSTIGVQLKSQYSALSMVIMLAGIFFSTYLLGVRGILYALSSALQQWHILLAGTYLSAEYGLVVGVAATAAVFTFSHRVHEWLWKLIFLFLWGVASISLYAWLGEPLINIGLHAGIGAILIRKKLLSSE